MKIHSKVFFPLAVALGCAFTLGELDMAGATITQVYAFQNSFNPSTLLQGNDGNFYGTLSGSVNTGLLFRVTAQGVFTPLAGFTQSSGFPFEGGPLVQTPNGDFYGTAEDGGGIAGYGTVFRLAANGELNPLVDFNGTNGAYPAAGLTLGPDGSLYGTTEFGGSELQRGHRGNAPFGPWHRFSNQHKRRADHNSRVQRHERGATRGATVVGRG